MMKIKSYGKVNLLTKLLRKLLNKPKGWGNYSLILPKGLDENEEEL